MTTDPRLELLQRCSFSDRDCVDHLVLSTRQPRASNSSTPAWPGEGYSCDFCDSWPLFVAKCRSCKRWLGLDCRYDCVSICDRIETSVANGSEAVQKIVDDRARFCFWCDNEKKKTGNDDDDDDGQQHNLITTLPPQPCGRVSGIVQRIVFVVEPLHSDDWQFHIAERMLCNILENVGFGSVLLYGLPCSENELDWIDAFQRIGNFAAEPHRFLPPGYVLLGDDNDDDTEVDDNNNNNNKMQCCISVVLATHTTLRTSERGGVRLMLSGAKSQSIEWFIEQMAAMFPQQQQQREQRKSSTKIVTRSSANSATIAPVARRLQIKELFLLSCHLFPDDAVGRRCETVWRTFGDTHNVAIVACNGNCIPFVQATMFSSIILTSLLKQHPLDNDFIPCKMLLFQPRSCIMSAVSQPITVGVAKFGNEQIQSLVEILTTRSFATNNDSDDDAESSPKRKRRTVRQNVERAAPPSDDDLRSAILSATTRDKIPWLKETLLKHWLFRARDKQVRGTALNYAHLFTAAAVVKSLVASRLASELEIATWIDDSLKDQSNAPTLQRTVKNVSFLHARLARRGMLNTTPLLSIQQRRRRQQHDFSLEFVIVNRLVDPPSLSYLRDDLDLHLFDAALDSLQKAWQQL